MRLRFFSEARRLFNSDTKAIFCFCVNVWCDWDMVCARWVSSRFWSSYLANLKPPRAKKSLRRPHSSPRWRKKLKNTPLESWDRELFIYGSKKRWCVHPWWTIFEIYFSCVIRVWRYMSLIWNAEIFDKILPSEHVFYVSWWNSNTQKGMHASLQSCIQCTPKSLWYPLARALCVSIAKDHFIKLDLSSPHYTDSGKYRSWYA